MTSSSVLVIDASFDSNSSSSGESKLNVGGCAQLQGRLVVKLPMNAPTSGEVNVQILHLSFSFYSGLSFPLLLFTLFPHAPPPTPPPPLAHLIPP